VSGASIGVSGEPELLQQLVDWLLAFVAARFECEADVVSHGEVVEQRRVRTTL
jgi:hypothetical protein